MERRFRDIIRKISTKQAGFKLKSLTDNFEKEISDEVVISSNGVIGQSMNPFPLHLSVTTGIKASESERSVAVYPNPVVDELSIDWSGVGIEDVSFNIVDCFGHKQKVNPALQYSRGMKIDVQALTPGTYFVKVFSKTGLLKVLKFVKV